jgi:hypothetical protein
MSVHPQDRDLEESSADDSDVEAIPDYLTRKTLSPSVSVKSLSHQRNANMSVTHGRTGVPSPIAISSEWTSVEDDKPTYYNAASCERDEETTLVEERGKLYIDPSVQPSITPPVA